MQKTILITGSTDGIGLELAKALVIQGHNVVLHGRNPEKLKRVEALLNEHGSDVTIESYVADLSRLSEVELLAKSILAKHESLDVVVNNAGIYKTSEPITESGLDVRFVVNTIAPYLLTKRLLPLLGAGSRVVNLSSAAQSPVNFDALNGTTVLTDQMAAYAQSKLAITMWTHSLAQTDNEGRVYIAVNPGSLLATKMVKEGFGMAGKDISIGSDILIRAALAEEFEQANGQYFDNDVEGFVSPHADVLNTAKCQQLIDVIETKVQESAG